MLNFGPGQAALPPEVLQQASEAVLNLDDSGLSVLEIPHRGGAFDDILEEAKSLVRELCGLTDDYEVLWLHGGGRLQFCMIPMNFLGEGARAGYIDSGQWSSEAIAYARYYGQAEVLASSKDHNYTRLPEWPEAVPRDLSYLHLTTNNTIYGTQWPSLRECPVPLVADMSSDILSRETDYNRCAVFYAVAQKNLGPAGTTMVAVRRDMLDRVQRVLPPMLDFRAQVRSRSVVNTPPVFAIYTALLMLRWTKEKTVAMLERENTRKAEMLYAELERNSLFRPVVSVQEHRSRMNVCFVANSPEIQKGFSDFCSRNNITGIEGHRFVGGYRVSLYNAVTLSAVEQLTALMQEYEEIIIQKH